MTTSETQDIQQQVVDDAPHDKYFHVMLNMDDDDLDPYQYRLLGHYRRMRVCWESIRKTAERTKMSVGMVSEVRQQLRQLGYITIEDRDDTTSIVRVKDRMLENVARYAARIDDGGCSSSEQGVHVVNEGVHHMNQGKNSLGNPVSSKDETACTPEAVIQKQDATPSEPATKEAIAQQSDSVTSARKELTPGEALQSLLDGFDDQDRLPVGFTFKPYMREIKKLIKDGWTVDDFRKAGKIIRRWNDANGSPLLPAAAGTLIILFREALGLVKRGFKSRDVEAFVRAEKQQDFWRGRQVSLEHVAKNIKAVSADKRPPTTADRLALEAYIRTLPREAPYVAPNHAL